MDKKKRSLIEKLKEFKKTASKEMLIEKIIFFGSRASGKSHEYSDVDLIVVSKEFGGMKFRWRATKMYDYWNLDYPVDFLCYTPEEFDRMRKQATIVREAAENGIAI
jgi:predicted nucleotidyltransferase